MTSEDKGSIAISFFKVGLAYFSVTLVLGLLMITGRGYSVFGPQGAKIAHVHAGLIGFVTMIIMGSMYQIVPTLTGSKLYGDGLPAKQFWLFNLGVFGLFLTQLLLRGTLKNGFFILFGAVVLLGSILFAYIIFKTIGQSRSKTPAVTLSFFKVAILYYIAGITMGLLMTLFPGYFSRFFLGKTAHAHLGTLGFITMTIFGAEYQMFPMLSLRKLKSERWARINLWAFALAVAGLFIGLMSLSTLVLTLFVVLALASVYIFLGNMLLTFIGAKWSGLDISVKFLLAGQLFLFITTGIGASMGVLYHFGLIDFLKAAGLAGEAFGIYQLIWAHAHLALIGFVSLTIMGAMYHLAPMLVWMERYGPKMGKEKVPNIQDLFSQRLAHVIFWSSFLGLFGILVGSLYGMNLLLRGSAYVIAGAGLLFSYAMYRVML